MLPAQSPVQPPSKCVVPSCLSATDKNTGMIFIKFPKFGRERFQLWCDLIGQKRLVKDRYYICQKHFVPGDFGPDRLHKTAVPSLSLGEIAKELPVPPLVAFADEMQVDAMSRGHDLDPDINQPIQDLLPTEVPIENVNQNVLPDPPTICRLCLLSKPSMDKISIDLNSRLEFAEMYEAITAIPFEFDNGCSETICPECMSNVMLLTKIRNEFIAADKWWKSYLEDLSKKQQNIMDLKEFRFVPTVPSPVAAGITVKEELVECAVDLIQNNETITNNGVDDDDDDDDDEATSADDQHNRMSVAIKLRIKKEKRPPMPRRIKGRRPSMHCDICATKRNLTVSFENKRYLNAHIKEHINVCPVCTDCFFSKSALEQHRRMCFQIPRTHCDFCDTKMTKNFRQHVTEHHPDVTLPECEKCGAKFARKYNLVHHWRNHMRQKVFKCSFCEKAFTTKFFLTAHERTHTNERPFVCDICPSAFKQITAMHIHRKNHFRDKPFVPCIQRKFDSLRLVRVKCSLCRFSTAAIKRWSDHMAVEHGQIQPAELAEIKNRICRKCRRVFATIDEKMEHSKEHLKFKCNYCTKRFRNAVAVNVHMKIHRDTARPHVCGICESSFTCRANLRRHHIIIHENDRQYKCDLCSKAYLEKYQLTRHIRFDHMNIRQVYQCDYCSKEFGSRIGILDHMFKKHLKPSGIDLTEAKNGNK